MKEISICVTIFKTDRSHIKVPMRAETELSRIRAAYILLR